MPDHLTGSLSGVRPDSGRVSGIRTSDLVTVQPQVGTSRQASCCIGRMSHGQILSGQLSMVTSDARNDSFGRSDLAMLGCVHDNVRWFCDRGEICFSLPIEGRYGDGRRN